jgi:hypothetical protein
MTEDEAMLIVAEIAAAYPTWKADSMSARVMARAVAEFDFADAQAAVDNWIAVEQWAPVPAQMRSAIGAAENKREWDEKLPALLESRLACDGSGYVQADNVLAPCPRCNPFLRERWKAGRWHDEIRKEDRPEGFHRPPRCRPYDETNVCTFEQGIEIARKAYVAERSQQGVDLDTIEGDWLNRRKQYFGRR